MTAWLLPISITLDMKGYEAAESAHNILMEGANYFTNMGSVDSNITLTSLLKNIVNIVAGLPNILFILSAIFLIRKKRLAFYFAASGLLVMVIWGMGINPVGGYALWVIAGAGAFILAADLYKTENNIPYHRLPISGPLIICYVVGALILLSETINTA